jgi:hypothetical protein
MGSYGDFLSSFLLAYSGYVLLCLSTPKQLRRFWRCELSRLTILSLRVAGWFLLAISIVPWLRQTSVAIGIVSWLFCILPLPALVLVFLWPFRPKSLTFLGLIGAPVALILQSLLHA